MKLRIQGDSIRLRLTRPEVEALGGGNVLEETTHFPDGSSLRYRLESCADSTTLSAHFSAGLLIVRVGRQAAIQWSCDAVVGIESSLALPHGGVLRILVEKDFECLHPTRGETAAGAYPNPARTPSPDS